MSERSKRVLVVDDHVDSADMIAEMLRARGLDVWVANESQAALELAAMLLPEVALLDIGLPGIDGYELARRLARSVIGCRLIAVTGYGNERDRARAQAAGFAVHLTKPVTAAAILAAIATGEPADELVATRPRTHVDGELENATSGAPDAVSSVSDRR